ncbi:hypothetical protein [Cereibacter changlensis]|uniref:hypothetical protein n=1 Tax=Cereibacter changlensis TaxID=402884 RepID=UPI0015E69A25|nr:hypothetical protein [Cereibacter changlensis]
MTVLAAHLGLSGPDAEFLVVEQVYRLLRQIKLDIDAAELDDAARKTVDTNLSRFSGLENLTQYHYTIEQARAKFLSADSLVGLSTIDHELSGRVEFIDISREAKELANSFRSIRDEVDTSGIKPELKVVLLKRLSQIIAALENYYFFREDELADITAGLVGSLVLSRPTDKESVAIYERVAGVLGKLISAVGGTNKFLASADGALKNGHALAETLQSLRG